MAATWPEEVVVDGAAVPVVLRAPDPIDAEAISAAVRANRDHLRRFLAWAEEPLAVDQQAVRLAVGREAYEQGGDVTYTIFSGEEVIGGLGLHRRRGPGRIEIGYWLVADAEGHGIITTAVRQLLAVCFADPTIDIAQIRCHRDNVRSAAVPARLGFDLVGEEDDSLVWELHRLQVADPAAGTAT
jgi:RimJ/RimL family protein N-acetyltransferase